MLDFNEFVVARGSNLSNNRCDSGSFASKQIDGSFSYSARWKLGPRRLRVMLKCRRRLLHVSVLLFKLYRVRSWRNCRIWMSQRDVLFHLSNRTRYSSTSRQVLSFEFIRENTIRHGVARRGWRLWWWSRSEYNTTSRYLRRLFYDPGKENINENTRLSLQNRQYELKRNTLFSIILSHASRIHYMYRFLNPYLRALVSSMMDSDYFFFGLSLPPWLTPTLISPASLTIPYYRLRVQTVSVSLILPVMFVTLKFSLIYINYNSAQPPLYHNDFWNFYLYFLFLI